MYVVVLLLSIASLSRTPGPERGVEGDGDGMGGEGKGGARRGGVAPSRKHSQACQCKSRSLCLDKVAAAAGLLGTLHSSAAAEWSDPGGGHSGYSGFETFFTQLEILNLYGRVAEHCPRSVQLPINQP